jgi:glycosyltransferase involved in cell wall biosynthesis
MARVPGAVLAVAGSGHARREVEKAAQGHAHRVLFLGVRADVADLIAAADLLVSPSDCEGFGLTMAEAMWCGCPVLATPVGFLEDRPDLAGLVPRTAGPAAWAAAIRKTLAAPALSRTAHAQAEARRLFAPDRFAREWSELLLSLAPPSPREALDAARRARSCVHRVPCGCNGIDCVIHGLGPASRCLACADLTLPTSAPLTP